MSQYHEEIKIHKYVCIGSHDGICGSQKIVVVLTSNSVRAKPTQASVRSTKSIMACVSLRYSYIEDRRDSEGWLGETTGELCKT